MNEPQEEKIQDDTVSPQEMVSDFEFTKLGDENYIAVWKRLGIISTVTRFSDGRDKSVSAELMFSSNRLTNQGHLRHGKIPLTSTTSRNGMVKSLHEREPSIERSTWDALMEQLCISVLEDYRKGSTPELITGLTDFVKPDWLIDPLIQVRNPTLIFGAGSAGKSLFAQYLSVLCDAGFSHNGLVLKEKTRVLYLDWETTKEEIDNRVSMIRKSLGLNRDENGEFVKAGIEYLRMTKSLEYEKEKLKGDVIDGDFGLVVIDSLGSAIGGDANSQDLVLKAYLALRELNVSSLIIDHPNKGGIGENTSGLSSLHGSIYKVNSSRQVFEMIKNQDVEDSTVRFALFHRKANNSALMREIGFKYVFENNQLNSIDRISREQIANTPISRAQSQLDQVLNFLRKGSKSAEEINSYLSELNNKKITVSTRLSEWADKGIIVAVHLGSNRKKYRLPGSNVFDEEPEQNNNEEGDGWTEA